MKEPGAWEVVLWGLEAHWKISSPGAGAQRASKAQGRGGRSLRQASRQARPKPGSAANVVWDHGEEGCDPGPAVGAWDPQSDWLEQG